MPGQKLVVPKPVNLPSIKKVGLGALLSRPVVGSWPLLALFLEGLCKGCLKQTRSVCVQLAAVRRHRRTCVP